jgi:tetratricopeptide (TPR) repeat protein
MKDDNRGSIGSFLRHLGKEILKKIFVVELAPRALDSMQASETHAMVTEVCGLLRSKAVDIAPPRTVGITVASADQLADAVDLAARELKCARRALYLVADGDYDHLRDTLHQWVSECPESATVHYLLAKWGDGHTAESSVERDQRREEHLNEAIRREPNFVEALIERGRHLACRGRIDEAILDFSKVIDPCGILEASYARAALFIAKKRYKDAAHDLLRFVVAYPDHARALRSLGECLQECGQHREACYYLREAELIDKTWREKWSSWGKKVFFTGGAAFLIMALLSLTVAQSLWVPTFVLGGLVVVASIFFQCGSFPALMLVPSPLDHRVKASWRFGSVPSWVEAILGCPPHLDPPAKEWLEEWSSSARPAASSESAADHPDMASYSAGHEQGGASGESSRE